MMLLPLILRTVLGPFSPDIVFFIYYNWRFITTFVISLLLAKTLFKTFFIIYFIQMSGMLYHIFIYT